MKRCLAILTASLMLVFVLTACGGNRDQQNNQTDNATTNESMGGTAGTNGNNGGNNGGDTGAANSGDSGMGTGSSQSSGSGSGVSGNGSSGSGADNSKGNTITNDIRDTVDDIAGNGTVNSNRSTTGGVSYEQMLRNAHVHDTDGDLTDHENSVTNGKLF